MSQRISPDHPIRRQLFPCDVEEEAAIDNVANLLQEEMARDRQAKSNKWNFDFENETPLPGDFEWIRCTATGGFIGVNTRRRPQKIEDINIINHNSINIDEHTRDTDTIERSSNALNIDNFEHKRLINETTPKKNEDSLDKYINRDETVKRNIIGQLNNATQ